ncbi:MAG: methyltransferase domain-containing protein [Halobacteriota archaeon]
MLRCRICENELGEPFLSLGNSPLSNAYLSKEELKRNEWYYPLDLYVCDKCYLVQLEEFEAPENIFSADYAYFSSYSGSWLEHCRRYSESVVKRFVLDHRSFVVEIGSNDGYLLQYFKRFGIPILGIEPAVGAAEEAIKRGIPTDTAFFNTSYAKQLQNGKQADLLIGNNVLAHNPDLHDFVEGIQIALKPDGVVTMEFPHLLRLIKGNQFDTVYHEHFSYFSFRAALTLFAKHDLEVFDVEEISTHGGSLRIYARHKNDASKPQTHRVEELLKKEAAAGLFNLDTYDKVGENVALTKRLLLQCLITIKNSGKQIVGYGAPAKGNTLLNYCGIRTDFLDYTVDRNPAKQGKFLPGTHLPIQHPDAIKQQKPDYILILPWNIKNEIIGQLSYVREWGGKFIIPIPTVTIE